MKTLRTAENRWSTDWDDSYGIENLKIYFRIPLTIYFVGKYLMNTEPKGWSKLAIFTKGWDGNNYYWKRI